VRRKRTCRLKSESILRGDASREKEAPAEERGEDSGFFSRYVSWGNKKRG